MTLLIFQSSLCWHCHNVLLFYELFKRSKNILKYFRTQNVYAFDLRDFNMQRPCSGTFAHLSCSLRTITWRKVQETEFCRSVIRSESGDAENGETKAQKKAARSARYRESPANLRTGLSREFELGRKSLNFTMLDICLQAFNRTRKRAHENLFIPVSFIAQHVAEIFRSARRVKNISDDLH